MRGTIETKSNNYQVQCVVFPEIVSTSKGYGGSKGNRCCSLEAAVALSLGGVLERVIGRLT